MTQAREAILARVRAALEHPSHLPEAPADTAARIAAQMAAATPADRRGLANQFKKEVETVSGECYILTSADAAADKLIELLELAPAAKLALDGDPLSAAVAAKLKGTTHFDAAALPPEERRKRLPPVPTALVTADFGIADTGTLVVRFDAARSGWSHVLPETIYTLLPAGRLLPHLQALVERPEAGEFRNIVMITGPSRTADIEKILILGAHGPKRLVVLIVME